MVACRAEDSGYSLFNGAQPQEESVIFLGSSGPAEDGKNSGRGPPSPLAESLPDHPLREAPGTSASVMLRYGNNVPR